MPKKSKSKSSRIPLILLIAGILLVLVSLGLNFYQSRVLSFSSEYEQSKTTSQKTQSIPKELEIKNLGIDLEIKPAEIKSGIWEINPNGASYLLNSGYPGNPGNIVIYGHNKKNLLGSLLKAREGQVIKLTTADGKLHTYIISNIFEVNPTQVEVLKQTKKEMLTLYTCTGLFDSKRLIIQAKPFI